MTPVNVWDFPYDMWLLFLAAYLKDNPPEAISGDEKPVLPAVR